MELEHGRAPASLDTPLRHDQMLGRFRLRPTVVVNQAHYLAFFDGKMFHRFMEGAPFLQLIGVLRGVGRFGYARTRVTSRCAHRVAKSMYLPGEVVPGQVEQLAAHLFGGQAKEIAYRGRLDFAQGVKQPQEGVMQEIAGFFPAAYCGESPQHLAGEAFQPDIGSAEQFFAGGEVAGADALDQAAELRGVKRGVVHRHTFVLSHATKGNDWYTAVESYPGVYQGS